MTTNEQIKKKNCDYNNLEKKYFFFLKKTKI